MSPSQEVPVRCNAVSAILIKGEAADARVLMLKRAGRTLPGQWCQVAGSIEAGETAWQAAVREIREETSLVPERFYSADYCEQFYMTEPEQVAVVPVFVGFVSPDRPVALNREHSEYRWTTFDEAQTLVPFGGQRNMFEFVRREFVERRPNELLCIEVPV